MRIMLTSYGVSIYPPTYHGADNIFSHMPPVDMNSFTSEFIPPYALLLLCESLIIDEGTYGALLSHRRSRAYDGVAEALTALRSEGLVELVDYRAILQQNQLIWDAMTAADLAVYPAWADVLGESKEIWRSFARLARSQGYAVWQSRDAGAPSIRDQMLKPPTRSHGEFLHMSGHGDALQGDGPAAIEIAPYIAYVNANLVLSAEIGVPLHDWDDFSPFYRRKFRAVGYSNPPGEKFVDSAEALFSISFPEFAVHGVSHLMKLVRHRHVDELRALVSSASTGTVSFDEDFARRTLMEVLKGEIKSSRIRKIAGYVTAPLGLLPGLGGVAQFAAQEIIDSVVSQRIRKSYRWFYMLSSATKSGLDERAG